MKCPKCGSEENGAFCTQCGTPLQELTQESAQKSVQESVNQEAGTTENSSAETEDTSYFAPPNPETTSTPKKDKPKISKRTILEIAGGVLLVIFMIAAIGGNSGVSKDEYEQLKEDYLSAQEELEEVTALLEETTEEFESYKSEMSKFEELSDEEMDAIIAELDAAEAEEQARQEAVANATTEQLNALGSAESYISYMGFSYNGLIEQLEYEGYSTEAATYAADNCGADWNEEAAESAQSYMEFMSFSRQGLIDQLLYEGFTQEQAEYGASAVGY